MVRVLGIFLLLLEAVQAKDFGVQGATYSVIEENLLEHVQRQLANLPEATLRMKQLEVQERVKQSVVTPNPVSGIHKTSGFRTYAFEPSITVDKDIRDHQGRIIATKGRKVNPLTTIQLKDSFLIFDGSDLEQIKWAEAQGDHTKWVLIKGRPFDLMKQYERAVYFDQGGAICKHFKITAIPAIVRQNGQLLEIIEGFGGGDAH